MNIVDVNPIIEKVKEKITVIPGMGDLYILTDDNPDNLSFIHAIKRINEKEQYFKSGINVLNSATETFPDHIGAYTRIYIMSSVARKYNKKVKAGTKLRLDGPMGVRVFSEEPYNPNNVKITPTPDAIIDIIQSKFGEDLTNKNILILNRSKLIGNQSTMQDRLDVAAIHQGLM